MILLTWKLCVGLLAMSSTFQASCIDVLTIIPFDQWRDNTMMIIATLDSCGMFIQRDHITYTIRLVLREMFFQRFWLVLQTDNGCFLALQCMPLSRDIRTAN